MLVLSQLPMFVVGLLVALFVVISVMMMLIVLIQRPQGGGLSEAFGSASGSGHTAFGAKTGDALTFATIFVFVLFIGFAVGLNYIVKPPTAAVESVPEAAPAGTPAPGGETPPASPSTPAPAGTDQPSSQPASSPQSAEQPAEPAKPAEEPPAAPPKE